MKPKHLFLAAAVLLLVGGFWLAGSVWRAKGPHESSAGVGVNTPRVQSQPGPGLRPPDPNRRFRELTPEERVQLARQPQGIGG